MGQVYTPHDRALRKECTLIFDTLTGPPHEVVFQFPPRILSDNRKGAWKEGDMRGTEPVAVFETSGPREISLIWTYIVDYSKNDDGKTFSTLFIAEQVKAIRGYFAGIRAIKDRGRNLVVMFKYALFGGAEPMSARIKSIDVKHSDTLVFPNADTTQAYPLRTDIAVELRLWTKGGADEDTQDLADLRDAMNTDWY